MKIRRSIFWVCSGVIVLLALAVWLGRRMEKTTPSEATVTQPTSNSAASQAGSTSSAPEPTPPGTAPVTLTTPPVAQKSKEQQMGEILSTENDVPIVYYGKLEDQFGNPVSGAEVTGNTIIYNGTTEGGARFTTTSDAGGFFKLDCGKGERLGIMPRKAGYALASLNGGGFYTHLKPEAERQHPDPNNPVVIKMWKLQGAEPLASINQRYKVNYSGSPLTFDLLTGKAVPNGGDIKITINRAPGTISSRNRQDWSVTLEAVDGGIMESAGQEAIAYWAPEAGYEPTAALNFSTNAPYKWLEGFTKGFFLKSRNGQVYTKLGVSFSINEKPEDPIDITFSGAANTNGSRNWEGDKNTYKP